MRYSIEHNQDINTPVAIYPWSYKGNPIAEALSLCGDFNKLHFGSKVLIKPNLVSWIDSFPYAPFGVITTTVLLDRLISYLKDVGVRNITLGDGCALNKEFGSETHILFDRLGYNYFVKRYGISLVDFNQTEFDNVNLGPYKLKVSQTVNEADCIINVPALKTHEYTQITLGFKNLKGILHSESKKSCHNRKYSIDKYLVEIAKAYYPNLTIIDGIYMLERGPMFTGRAHRSNIIVAGKDMFSVDLAGSTLMGIKPIDVEHLSVFAEDNNRSLDIDSIPIKGIDIKKCVRSLEIKSPWIDGKRIPAVFEAQNLRGFEIPYPKVLCTGCTYIFPLAVLLILSANQGKPFPGYELLAGKDCEPSGKAKKSFLLGNCPIKSWKKDSNIKEAVCIPGCPPTIQELVKALKKNDIEVKPNAVHRYFNHLVNQYEKSGFNKSDYWFK